MNYCEHCHSDDIDTDNYGVRFCTDCGTEMAYEAPEPEPDYEAVLSLS